MLHDPEFYPDPFIFDPERHIPGPGKVVQRDPRKVCFGFGRRVCPGMYLAEASLFSCFAMSLAVFDIEKATENGVPITPAHENTSGIIRLVPSFTTFIFYDRLMMKIPATPNRSNASSSPALTRRFLSSLSLFKINILVYLSLHLTIKLLSSLRTIYHTLFCCFFYVQFHIMEFTIHSFSIPN